MKKLWVLCTFLGVPIAIVGLVLTLVITDQTGHACDTVDGPGTCTNDPKVLLGVAPLLVGLGISGVGLWRWIATASKERASRPPRPGGGGLAGKLEAWSQAQTDSVMARYNVPGAPGAANRSGVPPPDGTPAGTADAPPAPPRER
jgi:hypothetical protein